MRRLAVAALLVSVALALALAQDAAAQTATEWSVSGPWTLVFTRAPGCARCPPGPVTYQLTLAAASPGSFTGTGNDVGNVYGKFNGGAAVANDTVTVTGTTDKGQIGLRISYADTRVGYTPLIVTGQIATDGTLSGTALLGGSGAGSFTWRSTAGRATVAPARPAAAAASPSAPAAAGPLACPAALGGWALRNDPKDPAYSAIVGAVFRVTDVIAGAQGVTPALFADSQGWLHLECQYRPPDPKQVPSSNIPYVNVSWAESGTGSGGALFSGVKVLCTGDPLTRPDPQTGVNETLITSADKRAAAGYATGGLISDATFRAVAQSLLAAASSRAQPCPKAGVVGAVPPPGATPIEDRTDPTSDDVGSQIVAAVVDFASDTGVPVTTALITVLSVLLGIPTAADVIGGAGTATAGTQLIDPETGKPFAGWEPGRYGADRDGRTGQVGDLWYGGRWLSRARVEDELEKDRLADAARARDSDVFRRGTDEARAAWQAQKQRDADAGFRGIEDRDAWRAQQQAARHALDTVIATAIDKGSAYDDIYTRALDNAYNPDHSIDVGYVRKLHDSLRARIVRDAAAPDELLHPGFSSAEHQALVHTAIRVGMGVFSGGTSEIGWAIHDGYKGMESAQVASRRDLSRLELFRAGVSSALSSHLPTNTYHLLQQKDWSASDLAGSLGADVLAVMGTADTGMNLRSSFQMVRSGVRPTTLGGAWRIATARGNLVDLVPPSSVLRRPVTELVGLRSPSDLARWPTARPPIDPAAPGRTAPPEILGMGGKSADITSRVLDEMHTETGRRLKTIFRDTTGKADELRAAGLRPKPHEILDSTAKPEDVHLGGPVEAHTGKVAHYAPRDPNTGQPLYVRGPNGEVVLDSGHKIDWARFEQQHGSEVRQAVESRLKDQMRTFPDRHLAMEQHIAAGRYHVDDSGLVVHTETGKHLTGDYDGFAIKQMDKDGGWVDAPAHVQAEVEARLRAHGIIQHGFHQNFRPKGLFDPRTGARLTSKLADGSPDPAYDPHAAFKDVATDYRVQNGYVPGPGRTPKPLMEIAAGEAPRIAPPQPVDPLRFVRELSPEDQARILGKPL